MPDRSRFDLARLIAEALKEEAEAVPLPSAEKAWGRLRSRLGAGSRPGRAWWRLVPAAGVAAALILIVGGLLLAGPAHLGWFQPRSDRALTEEQMVGDRYTAGASLDNRNTVVQDPTRSAPGAAADADTDRDVEAGRQSPLQDIALPSRVKQSKEVSPQEEPPALTPNGLQKALPVPGEGVGPAGENGSAEEEQQPADAARRPQVMAFANRSSDPAPPEQCVTWAEACEMAPFPLPRPTLLPPAPELSNITVRRLSQDQVMVRLSGDEGNIFVRLQVANVPPSDGGKALLSGATAQTVQLGDMPGLLQVENDVTRLSWRKDNLYVDMETNLETTQALDAARSLQWEY